MNIEMASKKYKSNNNNKIYTSKLDERNKSTSEFSIYQDNLNLIPADSKKTDKIDMSFLEKYLSSEFEKEDQRITAEYFKLIRIDELINCIFLLMTIGSSFIYNETKVCTDDCEDNESIQKEIIDLSLIFSSISTLFFIINLIIKYRHYFLLYKSAKYIQTYTNFYNTKLFQQFILEFIFAILHPNLLFKNKYFTISKKLNLKEVEYNVNDMLIIVQCFRLVYLIMIFVILSDFYSPRADRICKMMGKHLNLFFSFRALFINHTAIMLGYCFIIICSMLSYMLKVLSQPITFNSNSRKFHNFGNCFWFCIITMTTVGYGDIFPETTLQRIVGCLIAMMGNILVALIVSFFQGKINLKNEETNALEFIRRINKKENVMKASAEYFKATMLYRINKKKMESGIIPQNKTNIIKLINLAKNKVESRKKFKNLFHKFHINFKMETDVDKIKKKIDNLDYAEIDLSNYINLINIKIKELIKNINGYSNNKNNFENRIKNENNIVNDENSNQNKNNSIIHEREEPESKSEPK